MTRKTPFALAAAAALLLSACGSSDPGTATPSSTATSTTASSPAMTSDSSTTSTTSTSSSTSTSESTSESTDESTSDGTLDQDTEQFFTTFCGTVTDFSDTFESFNPTAEIDSSSPETIRDSFAEAVRPVAAELTSAGETIGAENPPTFDGGADVQAAIVSAFTDAGTALNGKIDAFAATPADQVQASMTTLATDIQTVFTDFQADLTAVDADVPADVEAAITDLPECAGI